MPPPSKTPVDALEALIVVAPLASRWIERLLARHDPPLTLAQYLALGAIADEQVTGGELARRTGVTGPAVSQLLTGLSAARLVERHPGAHDRRTQALALSPRGERSYRSAQAMLHERFGSLLGELPRPEAHALARALPRVQAALSGTAPPPRPHPPKPPPSGHPPHVRRHGRA